MCSLYCICSKLELARAEVDQCPLGSSEDGCMGPGNFKNAAKYISHAILVYLHAAAGGAI